VEATITIACTVKSTGGLTVQDPILDTGLHEV